MLICIRYYCEDCSFDICTVCVNEPVNIELECGIPEEDANLFRSRGEACCHKSVKELFDQVWHSLPSGFLIIITITQIKQNGVQNLVELR